MGRLALEKVGALSLAAPTMPVASDEPLRTCFSGPTFEAASEKKLTGLTASAGEIAAALGLKEASFRRKARAMHRDHGFPLPLRGCSWTWSVRAVTTWIEAAGSVDHAPVETGRDARDTFGQEEQLGAAIVLEQHRELRRRYGGRA